MLKTEMRYVIGILVLTFSVNRCHVFFMSGSVLKIDLLCRDGTKFSEAQTLWALSLIAKI